MVDPLSVAVGALVGAVCVLLYQRLVTRRTDETRQQARTAAICTPCEEPFSSTRDALSHAKDTHNAPDDAAAQAIIELP